jgi:hypothetical protein
MGPLEALGQVLGNLSTLQGRITQALLLCPLLTSLVGSNVHSRIARWQRALARNAIDRLNFKGVACVGQQVANVDLALCQAQLPRHKLHVVIAA